MMISNEELFIFHGPQAYSYFFLIKHVQSTFCTLLWSWSGIQATETGTKPDPDSGKNIASDRTRIQNPVETSRKKLVTDETSLHM